MLNKEDGDAIIVGPGSAKALEQNLLDPEKGQLPEEVVVQALEEAWLRINGMEPKYFHWLNVFDSHALASLWQSICEPFIVVLLFT